MLKILFQDKSGLGKALQDRIARIVATDEETYTALRKDVEQYFWLLKTWDQNKAWQKCWEYITDKSDNTIISAQRALSVLSVVGQQQDEQKTLMLHAKLTVDIATNVLRKSDIDVAFMQVSIYVTPSSINLFYT
jgi:hypothetical protein